MMMYSSVKLELLVFGTGGPSPEGSAVGDDMAAATAAAAAAATKNVRFRWSCLEMVRTTCRWQPISVSLIPVVDVGFRGSHSPQE